MTEELYVCNRDDWRAWLKRNYDSKKEVWLIYYKKHSGKLGIPYDDSVEEALCFGWVDSIIRKIDDEKFARKFTLRTGRSTWSEANKKRVEKMVTERKMTEAGMKRIRESKNSGMWFKPSVIASYKGKLEVPPYMKEALIANKKALNNFNKLAESYKRNFVAWIDCTKKEETRKRRLIEAIRLLELNQKLGMK
ncbi:MAG TPA: YdeI/OmpD-associated family protein [Acidobacteriota bacterium]|nr:YdeI/OmpD-associated family protein [Acidobacteriota bacterium]